MASEYEVLEVAKALCRSVTDKDCVMDEEPERMPCTEANCRMVTIARRALEEAQAGGPAARNY